MVNRTMSRRGSNGDSAHDFENKVSNLPLLFAGGYPTSLDKITETQLEAFIPFMVNCSMGQIHLVNANSYAFSKPEWWPDDVRFAIPLKRPANFRGDWQLKMKKIVASCYGHHKSIFLLRFCENLVIYQPEQLRFINNFNSTTSLFDRFSNKLLVTFRNENMVHKHLTFPLAKQLHLLTILFVYITGFAQMYDRVQNFSPKKTLLPRTQCSRSMEVSQEQMVEQALFDIYLCDNCDAELYSLDAYTVSTTLSPLEPIR